MPFGAFPHLCRVINGTEEVSALREKKLKIAIIVLSGLLAAGLVALGAMRMHNRNSGGIPTQATVPDNIITQEEEKTEETKEEPDETRAPETDTASPVESADAGTDTSTDAAADDAGTRTPSQTAAGQTDAGAYETAPAVTLHKRNAQDNIAFQAGNMFPGDSETMHFCVRVSHKGNVTLRFHADIRPGYEKLAEVLRCRIVLPEKDEVIYDGLMSGMPQALTHALNTNTSTKSEVYYEITAYLETSVGNEYMNQSLVADFRWWVEETEQLDPPVTGDSSNLYLWIGVAAGSLLLLLLLLLKKSKKEDAADER